MFKSITGYQERDSCLALTFLLLVIWCFFRHNAIIYAAMAVLLAGMIWPGLMKPFAFAWYGLAMLLGKVTSSILLTVVWVCMVLPVGLARRLMGRDALGLKKWRNGSESCFVTRDHVYTSDDLKNPY